MIADIGALEGNLWEMHRDFGRVPGAEVHDDPDLLWYTLPSTNGWLNGASRANLDPGAADGRIADVVAAIHGRGRSVLWHVTPSSGPPDLGERLARAAFKGSPSPGMVCELAGTPPAAGPGEIEIRPVADAVDVVAWVDTFNVSFGLEPRGAEHPWVDAFGALALGDGVPYRLFLGRVDGDDVACSLAFCGGGAVGLYGVGTVPSCRGRGYGGALTQAGMDWGRDRGERLAVLEATKLGDPVYTRLGYRTVCETSHWALPAPAV